MPASDSAKDHPPHLLGEEIDWAQFLRDFARLIGVEEEVVLAAAGLGAEANAPSALASPAQAGASDSPAIALLAGHEAAAPYDDRHMAGTRPANTADAEAAESAYADPASNEAAQFVDALVALGLVTLDGADLSFDGAGPISGGAEPSPDGAEVASGGAEPSLDGVEQTSGSAALTPGSPEVAEMIALLISKLPEIQDMVRESVAAVFPGMGMRDISVPDPSVFGADSPAAGATAPLLPAADLVPLAPAIEVIG